MGKEVKYSEVLPSVLVTKEMLEKLRKYREKTGMSLGKIVRDAIEEYLKRHEVEQK